MNLFSICTKTLATASSIVRISIKTTEIILKSSKVNLKGCIKLKQKLLFEQGEKNKTHLKFRSVSVLMLYTAPSSDLDLVQHL